MLISKLAELKELKTLDLSDNVPLSSAGNIEKITSLEYWFENRKAFWLSYKKISYYTPSPRK